MESVRALPPEKGLLGFPRHSIMVTLMADDGFSASRKIYYTSALLLKFRIRRQFRILRRVMREVR